MTMRWQKFELSLDRTHHTVDKQPAYGARFLSVLTFHEPGLAPAKNGSGAFHINTLGEAAYPHRFFKTFGFYEGKAAIQDSSGWYHILPDGSPVYPERYAWCGNYQEGHCPVKDGEGNFFHLNPEGKKAYPEIFKYVGDFREGSAVVQNKEGLHTHIDFEGHLKHGKWFLDLDVYHKGFARAKEEKGWFHIDLQGEPLYSHRYKTIEPFYNGTARVETRLGALYLINEAGELTHVLRSEIEDEFHEVSAELVSYWRFFTLRAAKELQLFDTLPCSLSKLSEVFGFPETTTLKLLRALQEMGFVTEGSHQEWICTSKGAFMQAKHPYTLKYAGSLWKEEHLISWRNIVYSLKTEQPAFKYVFGKGWFEWLKEHPDKNKLYHAALAIYAKRDYPSLSASVDFTQHCSLLDVGGSTGTLLFEVLTHNPHLQGILLDLFEVTELVKVPPALKERFKVVSRDFFEDWPSLQVESVVLSRVLHDWADPEALKILQKVHGALSDNPANRLYILEKVQVKGRPSGALLDLNMLIMTGGVERTREDFERLLNEAHFVLEEIKPLNQACSILSARRKKI